LGEGVADSEHFSVVLAFWMMEQNLLMTADVRGLGRFGQLR
jgi:hypothetical protein